LENSIRRTENLRNDSSGLRVNDPGKKVVIGVWTVVGNQRLSQETDIGTTK
jgi:hypothetical protein